MPYFKPVCVLGMVVLVMCVRVSCGSELQCDESLREIKSLYQVSLSPEELAIVALEAPGCAEVGWPYRCVDWFRRNPDSFYGEPNM